MRRTFSVPPSELLPHPVSPTDVRPNAISPASSNDTALFFIFASSSRRILSSTQSLTILHMIS